MLKLHNKKYLAIVMIQSIDYTIHGNMENISNISEHVQCTSTVHTFTGFNYHTNDL